MHGHVRGRPRPWTPPSDEGGDAQGGGQELAFAAPPTPTLSIAGSSAKIPVRRVYCVGRNYWDHGIEMGGNPAREPPFFFLKPADAVVDTSLAGVGGAEVPYPHASENFHFECEMVLVINTPDGKPIGNVRGQGATDRGFGGLT